MEVIAVVCYDGLNLFLEVMSRDHVEKLSEAGQKRQGEYRETFSLSCPTQTSIPQSSLEDLYTEASFHTSLSGVFNLGVNAAYQHCVVYSGKVVQLYLHIWIC